MRPKRLRLEGVSKRDRNQVIADVGEAVTRAEGWIAGHTLFSNIAAAFQLSLPAGQLDAFCIKMAEAGIRLDAESLARLEAIAAEDMPEDLEVPTALSLTFLHNEPDLRRDIPAVPG